MGIGYVTHHRKHGQAALNFELMLLKQPHPPLNLTSTILYGAKSVEKLHPSQTDHKKSEQPC